MKAYLRAFDRLLFAQTLEQQRQAREQMSFHITRFVPTHILHGVADRGPDHMRLAA